MSKTLHNLIHSLQKAEKRSIKIAAGKDEKSFMKVYEALENMPEYDEKKLRAAFPTLSSSALSKAKETVQQHILKVLHHSHYHEQDELQLLDVITKVQIAKLKGQNELAMEMIADLKPKLVLMERNALLVYVQQLEIEIIRLRYLKDTSPKTFEKNYTELFSTLTKAENLAQYRHDTHMAQLLRTQYGSTSRVNEYQKYMDELARSPRFADFSKAESGLAADQYFIFWFWYHEMKHNTAAQADIISKWKGNADTRKSFFKKFPAHYYYILYQLGILSTQQQDKSSLNEAIKGLSSPLNTIEEAEYERLVYLFSVQANAMQVQQNFTAVAQLNPLFENIKQNYSRFLNAERDVYMQKQLAIAYLLKADYNTTLNFVNEVLNRHPKIVFSMLCQLRVMSMLCHIGLGNYLVLETLYRSFSYFVKGKTDLSSGEKLIIKFVQQVAKNNTATGIRKTIGKFLPEFKQEEVQSTYFFVPVVLEQL